MRGGAGCVGSAAQYEYVTSPAEYKNKIHPSPPMQEHVEKTDRYPKTKMI